MAILVTGGAGYIGSHVISLLGPLGEEIIILDNLSTGNKQNILFGKLVIGDLNNLSILENIFQNNKIEAVFHFAGSIVVPESVKDPIKYYQNNTENSLNLIKTCIKYNVKKFIFSSTAAVYGVPIGGSASEESQTNPINPYGRSKLMTEWMLKDASIAHDFQFVALRYFNVAGASQTGKIGQSTPLATHLIKIASELVANKRNEMKIFGTDYDTFDGTCIRDYIHVDDLANAHVQALSYLRNSPQSQILNCGYGHGYSVKEVLNVIEKLARKKLNIIEDIRRDGDPAILISKADKIKEIIGWEPLFDNLETIALSAINWELKS